MARVLAPEVWGHFACVQVYTVKGIQNNFYIFYLLSMLANVWSDTEGSTKHGALSQLKIYNTLFNYAEFNLYNKLLYKDCWHILLLLNIVHHY